MIKYKTKTPRHIDSINNIIIVKLRIKSHNSSSSLFS